MWLSMCIVMWKESIWKTIITVSLYCSISHVPATLQVLHARRVSQSPLVINCMSTGLPPTQAVWSRGSQILNDSEVYQKDSHLINRATSTYSNILTINQNIQDVSGNFACSISSTTTGPAQSSSITTGMNQCVCEERNWIYCLYKYSAAIQNWMVPFIRGVIIHM